MVAMFCTVLLPYIVVVVDDFAVVKFVVFVRPSLGCRLLTRSKKNCQSFRLKQGLFA